jgi:hypothetical protein
LATRHIESYGKLEQNILLTLDLVMTILLFIYLPCVTDFTNTKAQEGNGRFLHPIYDRTFFCIQRQALQRMSWHSSTAMV